VPKCNPASQSQPRGIRPPTAEYHLPDDDLPVTRPAKNRTAPPPLGHAQLQVHSECGYGARRLDSDADMTSGRSSHCNPIYRRTAVDRGDGARIRIRCRPSSTVGIVELQLRHVWPAVCRPTRAFVRSVIEIYSTSRRGREPVFSSR
jgi:hypothetical protein